MMAELGIDMRLAAKVAVARYTAFEWSGCEGSRWDRLPGDVQNRLVREARDWLFVLREVGLSVSELPEAVSEGETHPEAAK